MPPRSSSSSSSRRRSGAVPDVASVHAAAGIASAVSVADDTAKVIQELRRQQDVDRSAYELDKAQFAKDQMRLMAELSKLRKEMPKVCAMRAAGWLAGWLAGSPTLTLTLLSPRSRSARRRRRNVTELLNEPIEH